MARLATLLGMDHPLFKYNIVQLEKATGNVGIDIKLGAEVLQKAHAVMRKLGLDPRDSTLIELQNTLQQQIHNQALDSCSYVIYSLQGHLVSFNRIDIANNYHHELKSGDHMTKYACSSLKLELVRRYAEHERSHDVSVFNIFNEMGIDTEPIKKEKKK